MMTKIHFRWEIGNNGARQTLYIPVVDYRKSGRNKRYVEACFGKSIYSQEYQEKIERKLCVGNHKNCHLLFTKGNLRAGRMA